MKPIYFAVLFLTSIQAVEAQTPKKTPPASASSAAQPKFKAIWEPANYPKDINLLDVKFVSAEEGWAVGDQEHDPAHQGRRENVGGSIGRRSGIERPRVD